MCRAGGLVPHPMYNVDPLLSNSTVACILNLPQVPGSIISRIGSWVWYAVSSISTPVQNLLEFKFHVGASTPVVKDYEKPVPSSSSVKSASPGSGSSKVLKQPEEANVASAHNETSTGMESRPSLLRRLTVRKAVSVVSSLVVSTGQYVHWAAGWIVEHMNQNTGDDDDELGLDLLVRSEDSGSTKASVVEVVEVAEPQAPEAVGYQIHAENQDPAAVENKGQEAVGPENEEASDSVAMKEKVVDAVVQEAIVREGKRKEAGAERVRSGTVDGVHGGLKETVVEPPPEAQPQDDVGKGNNAGEVLGRDEQHQRPEQSTIVSQWDGDRNETHSGQAVGVSAGDVAGASVGIGFSRLPEVPSGKGRPGQLEFRYEPTLVEIINWNVERLCFVMFTVGALYFVFTGERVDFGAAELSSGYRVHRLF